MPHSKFGDAILDDETMEALIKAYKKTKESGPFDPEKRMEQLIRFGRELVANAAMLEMICDGKVGLSYSEKDDDWLLHEDKAPAS